MGTHHGKQDSESPAKENPKQLEGYESTDALTAKVKRLIKYLNQAIQNASTSSSKRTRTETDAYKVETWNRNDGEKPFAAKPTIGDTLFCFDG